MNYRYYLPFVVLFIVNELTAQSLPYYEIPPYPESFSAGTVAGRMVDGLGYRYYWATNGLNENDLDYRPSKEAQSARETINHIYGLSLTIVNAPQNIPNGPRERSEMTFEETRRATLENFKKASELLKSGKEGDMENYKVIFQRGDSQSEFPFWNMINGPIADAIYHTGQIVSFRRTTGNPINPKVSVFMGKNRN